MTITLTPEEINQLGASMRSNWVAVTLGYKLRIWEIIGYESWEEYLAGEHWTLDQKPLPKHQSRDVAFWASYGMSVEAISRITTLEPEIIRAELATATAV